MGIKNIGIVIGPNLLRPTRWGGAAGGQGRTQPILPPDLDLAMLFV